MIRAKSFQINNLNVSQNIMYRNIVRNCLTQTGFLQVNKTLIKKLGLINASVLSLYIDKDKYFSINFNGNDGWFYFTNDQQVSELCLDRKTIIKAKKYLIEKQIIFSKLKGLPLKEWFLLNFEKIHDLIGSEDVSTELCGTHNDSTSGMDKDTTSGMDVDTTSGMDKIIITEYNKNRIKTHSVPTEKISLKEKSKEYLPLAEKLSTIIQTKKNINISQTKINQWANDIRLMIETDGIEYVRIRKALKWYATNIGGKYIPVIESGGSLREKFLKLENAIEREKETDSSYVPKTNSNNRYKSRPKVTYKETKVIYNNK
jgi:hypothetical protein